MQSRIYGGLGFFAISVVIWMTLAGLDEHEQPKRALFIGIALIAAITGARAFYRAVQCGRERLEG